MESHSPVAMIVVRALLSVMTRESQRVGRERRGRGRRGHSPLPLSHGHSPQGILEDWTVIPAELRDYKLWLCTSIGTVQKTNILYVMNIHSNNDTRSMFTKTRQ